MVNVLTLTSACGCTDGKTKVLLCMSIFLLGFYLYLKLLLFLLEGPLLLRGWLRHVPRRTYPAQWSGRREGRRRQHWIRQKDGWESIRERIEEVEEVLVSLCVFLL